jgi:hypothetical protein
MNFCLHGVLLGRGAGIITSFAAYVCYSNTILTRTFYVHSLVLLPLFDLQSYAFSGQLGDVYRLGQYSVSVHNLLFSSRIPCPRIRCCA